MQTDEQLTHDLAAAFRAATTDLAYTGRVPAPRRSVLPAVPAALGLAAVAGVAYAATTAGPAAHPARTVAVSPPPLVATTAGRAPAGPVTRTLVLDGYRLTYTEAAGHPQLTARLVAAVPAGAAPVPVSGPERAAVGLDPTTHAETAYVTAYGRTYAITAPGVTRAELTTFLGAAPRPVPLVGPGS